MDRERRQVPNSGYFGEIDGRPASAEDGLSVIYLCFLLSFYVF